MPLRDFLGNLLRRRRDIVLVTGQGDEYHIDPTTVTTAMKQTGLQFVGESSGPDEEHFGDRLRDIYSEVLFECPEIDQAFLAQVAYGLSESGMALCLSSFGKQDRELVDTLAMIFRMRHSQATLDILFIPPERLDDLSSACKPFYDRSTYRPPTK